MAVKGCRKTATFVTRIRSRHIGNYIDHFQGLVYSITIPIALLIITRVMTRTS